MSEQKKRRRAAAASSRKSGYLPAKSAEHSADGSGESPQPKERQPRSRISNSKLIVFAFFAMTLIPLILLVLLEATLRLAGVGYPTDFFLRRENALIDNVKFGWRYFPPTIARRPYDLRIPAEKAADTYRIIVLGESAAWGDPDPSFSFGRILETMLRDQFPGHNFEVINGAMAAINSHVVRNIAADAQIAKPDAYVVYMGNNEVIGPFGPGTAFASFSSNLEMIRGAIWLKSIKLTQATAALISALQGPEGQPHEWAGMQMFEKNKIHISDTRLKTMYSHFSNNYDDICHSALKSGAALIVCNMAANMDACAPFASLNNPALDKDTLAKWEKLYAEACTRYDAGDTTGALPLMEQCVSLDPTHAESHYRLGRILARNGEIEKARAAYGTARDCDALRFRSDSKLNEIIEAKAKQYEAKFVDIIKAFEEKSTNGIPGEELMVDHVHMNFRGNHVIASALLPTVAGIVAKKLGKPPRDQQTPLSEQECAARLAYTRWSEMRVTEKNLQRLKNPPFTNQLENRAQHEALSSQLDALRTSLDQAAQEQCVVQFRDAITSRPDDWTLHENLADLLQHMKRSKEEAEELRKVLALLPHHEERHKWLGQSLLNQGKLEDGIASYKLAVDYNPTDVEALKGLAKAELQAGRKNEAIKWFRLATKTRPTAENFNELGEMYYRTRDVKSARAEFEHAIKRNPKYAPAITNLGALELEAGSMEAAISQFEAAVAAQPEYPDAHRYLGHVFMQRQAFDQAAEHYEKAIAVKPQSPEVYNNIAAAYSALGRKNDAIRHLETAVRMQPTVPQIQKNLAMLLLETGRKQDAAQVLSRARELAPGDPEIQQLLRQIQ